MHLSKSVLPLCLVLACYCACTLAAKSNRFTTVSSDTQTELKGKITELFTRLSTQKGGPTITLMQIVGARQQMRNGIFYEINIEANILNKKKVCKLGLLEQSWNKYQKLDITCGTKMYSVEAGNVGQNEKPASQPDNTRL